MTYNVKKQLLLEHLDEVMDERALHNEDKALAQGRRGNSELDEIKRLDQDIVDLESLIHDNEKLLNDETKSNAYELKINMGKKIVYGQKVMLRHMFSGKYLTLNSKKISQEHGCITLLLSDANEDSWFRLMPSEKIK